MNTSTRTLYSFEELGRSVFGKKFTSDDVMEELYKAMASTNITGNADATALRLENLDMMMSSVLFDESHLVLFNWLNKYPSTQPFYQWNRRNQYGSLRGSIGFTEGAGPGGSLAAWTRFGTFIKWLGVKRGITHQMMLTGQAGGAQYDPVAEENRDGTLDLLEKVERQLLWGDSSIDATIYDGLFRQVFNNTDAGSNNVLDMHGKPIGRDDITNIAGSFFRRKVQNFSNINAFMSGDTLSDLDRTLTPADRIFLPTTANDGFITGHVLAGHRTRFGVIPFTPSVFTEAVDTKQPLAVSTTTSAAPSTLSGSAGSPGSGTTYGHTIPAPPTGTNSVTWTPVSYFQAADAATYYYTVSSVGKDGESLGFTSSGVAVAATQVVTLTITKVSDTNITGYRVYRGKLASGADAAYIGMVAQGASNAVFIDTNYIMPGTDNVFILERTPSNMNLVQLAPLTKMILPQEQTTFPFYLLLYHTLVVKIPERQYILRNVGRIS